MMVMMLARTTTTTMMMMMMILILDLELARQDHPLMSINKSKYFRQSLLLLTGPVINGIMNSMSKSACFLKINIRAEVARKLQYLHYSGH